MAYAPWATGDCVCCEATCIVAINGVLIPAHFRPLATNASPVNRVRKRKFVSYELHLCVDVAFEIGARLCLEMQRPNNREEAAGSTV